MQETVNHIAKFTSDIWQIHPFSEGNTRATVIFIIKYLKVLGVHVSNDVFSAHLWNFRNVLGRANKLGDNEKRIDKILREIIFNILVHRDYSNAYTAQFVIEKDRIYTKNSNLPHGHGELQLNKFEPFPKNPPISKVFREIGYADELGSGMRNTNKYTKLYSGETPIFVEDNIFEIVIPMGNVANLQVGPEETDKEIEETSKETGKEIEETNKEIEETNKEIKKTNKEISGRIINLLRLPIPKMGFVP